MKRLRGLILAGVALVCGASIARADNCPPGVFRNPPVVFNGAANIPASTCALIIYSGSAPGTLTLPTVPFSGSILDLGPGVATLVGPGSQVNGAASLALSVGAGGTITGDPSLGWSFVGGIAGGGGASTTRTEVAKTSSYTVTSADVATDFNNAGAAGPITFTLPAWAVGLNYCFSNPTNQSITVQANTGNFITEYGVSTATAGTAISGAQYSMVCVVAVTSAIWQIDRHIGFWSLT